MEFAALGNHRKAIRAEIAKYAEMFRAAEIAAMTKIIGETDIDPDAWPPSLLAVLLASAARMIVMEKDLGMSGGHAETLAFIERYISLLEHADRGLLKTGAADAPAPAAGASRRRAPRPERAGRTPRKAAP